MMVIGNCILVYGISSLLLQYIPYNMVKKYELIMSFVEYLYIYYV